MGRFSKAKFSDLAAITECDNCGYETSFQPSQYRIEGKTELGRKEKSQMLLKADVQDFNKKSTVTFTNTVWKTDNEKVASVGGDGMVTAKGRGTANIIACDLNGNEIQKAEIKVDYSFFLWILDLLFGWLIK